MPFTTPSKQTRLFPTVGFVLAAVCFLAAVVTLTALYPTAAIVAIVLAKGALLARDAKRHRETTALSDQPPD